MQYIYYSIAFYGLIFLLLMVQKNNQKVLQDTKKISISSIVILFLFLLVRVWLASFSSGHPYDIKCFSLWAQKLADVGPSEFYAPDYFADYPPGYMLVLYVLGLIGKLFNIPPLSSSYSLLIKIPAILADLALGLMVYHIAKINLKEKNENIILFLVLLNPVLILNSSFWGQIDSFFTLFLLISLYLLYQKKYISAVVLYSLCALIKPQAFIFSPVFLCGIIGTKDFKLILKSAGTSILTFFIVSFPFFGLRFDLLIDKYMQTLGSYSYASVNAYNIYALLGLNWIEIKGIFWLLWQIIVLAGITSFSIWFYIKAKGNDKIFYTAYLLIVLVFNLSTKMHERYIFPALLLIFICYLYKKDKRLLYLFFAQTAAQLFNTGIIYINSVYDDMQILMTGVVSILNIIITVFSIYWGLQIYISDKSREIILPKNGKNNITKEDIAFMIIITLIYSLIAFYRLGDTKSPQTFYTVDNDVILDLTENKHIGKLMIYQGIVSSDAKIYFEGSDNGVSWQPLNFKTEKGITNEDSFHPVFNWQEYITDAKVRFIKISSSMQGQMIGEVGVFSPDGDIYDLYAPDGENELIDEQDKVVYSPSYLNSTYFDEIYHARTAYEIINSLPIYENTHPPLGKLIISLGILLFGMTPFGWRFMGTLFGILMLPVLFIIIKKAFGKSSLAVGGTVLLAADFMHFSLTRMATIDSYVTLFIMLSYLFMLYYFTSDFYEKGYKSFIPLGLCGLFFGLAISTKWIGFYSAVGLAVILIIKWVKAYLKYISSPSVYEDFIFRLAKTIIYCVLVFVIVPIIIYFCSYLPQMRYDLPEDKNELAYVLENQESMLNYHGKSVVSQSHPFSSKWYSWPIVKRPLWAYNDYTLPEGMSSTITIMGNPAIWWLGLACVASFLLYFAWRDWRALFFLISYLAQIIPWIFVERTTFIYHYFSCVPFMIVAICYIFAFLQENNIFLAKYIKYYYILSILFFIVFYPALSGLVVGQNYIASLRWFNDWIF